MELVLCMPDARDNRLVCIAAISSSHRSITAAGENDWACEKGSGSRHATIFTWNSATGKRRQLLGGDFARRIERAGIVDFSYLVITESEDLPQDFVGVFPK